MKFTMTFKSVAVVLFLLVVCLQVFADEIVTDYRLVPQHERSVARVTNFDPRVLTGKWEAVVHLESPTKKQIIARGYSERVPAGVASVASNPAYNLPAPQGGITIKAKNLGPTYGEAQLYEGWLVDEDTGYWLSVGVFNTDNFGNGRLNTATAPIGTMADRQKLFHPLDLYDAVAVTLEPYPDSDPRPSDNVVLYGKIEKPKQVIPQPTLQQKLWGVNKYYAPSWYSNPAANMPKSKESGKK